MATQTDLANFVTGVFGNRVQRPIFVDASRSQVRVTLPSGDTVQYGPIKTISDQNLKVGVRLSPHRKSLEVEVSSSSSDSAPDRDGTIRQRNNELITFSNIPLDQPQAYDAAVVMYRSCDVELESFEKILFKEEDPKMQIRARFSSPESVVRFDELDRVNATVRSFGGLFVERFEDEMWLVVEI